MKGTIDIVDAQGNKIHSEASVKFDGKDYPLKGSPIADAVSVKRINERQTDCLEERRKGRDDRKECDFG